MPPLLHDTQRIMDTTENIDYVWCGYIKAKFALDPRLSLSAHAAYIWALTVGRPRVTDHFVYVALGHDAIRDNDHARELLTDIAELEGKVTRLDFNVDYLGKLNFRAFYKLHDNDIKPRPQIVHSPSGSTVYLGKRSSARMLRTYDKRGEILKKNKTDIGFDLTRIEIEIKRNMIARYRALFMSGNTLAILTDIQELYGLRNFCKRHKASKPIEQREKSTDCFAFVQRFQRIISEAYNSDMPLFLDIIGGK